MKHTLGKTCQNWTIKATLGSKITVHMLWLSKEKVLSAMVIRERTNKKIQIWRKYYSTGENGKN